MRSEPLLHPPARLPPMRIRTPGQRRRACPRTRSRNLDDDQLPRSFRAQLPGALSASSIASRSVSNIHRRSKSSSMTTNKTTSHSWSKRIEPGRCPTSFFSRGMLRALIWMRRSTESFASYSAVRASASSNPGLSAATNLPYSPVIPSGFPVSWWYSIATCFALSRIELIASSPLDNCAAIFSFVAAHRTPTR